MNCLQYTKSHQVDDKFVSILSFNIFLLIQPQTFDYEIRKKNTTNEGHHREGYSRVRAKVSGQLR